MVFSDQPELWREPFSMLGTSAAALIGLLFIATSLHLRDIIDHAILRRRTFNNTCYLLVILVESFAVLVPQPTLALAGEVIGINCLGMIRAGSIVYGLLTDSKSYRSSGGRLYRMAMFIGSLAVGIGSGISLALSWRWAAHLLAFSGIALLVTVVFAAWQIMIGVGRDEMAK